MIAGLSLGLVVLAGGGIHWERQFDEAVKKARAQRKPVMVDFWADWCGWCKRLDQTTYADPAVAKLAQDFVAVKVNAEGAPEEMQVAARYEVTSLPTILFVSPAGHPVSRVNGFQGPGKFPRTLERARETAAKVMTYEAALEKNPNDADALGALGYHLFEQEFFEEARDLLAKARHLDAAESLAERRQTRMLLAIIQNYDQKFGEAEKLTKEALALEPLGEDEPKLLFILGRTYVKWGRKPEARKAFQKILVAHGESPMARKAQEQLAALGLR
jgi:thioredoxin-like negative regulator of GroEL